MDEMNNSHDAVVLSSINRAIREVSKGGVSVILVPGEVVFAYDVPTYVYESDAQLHVWVKAALDKHVVLVKTADIKIQKVIEICRELHFEPFAVLDFPEQNVSGSAFSMISSLPRILHSELDMFGKVEESKKESLETEKVEEVVKPQHSENDANLDETPNGKFAKLTRSFNG